MPINPKFRHLYGPEWDALATSVKDASGWKCQECGVDHGQWRERTDQTGPIKPGQTVIGGVIYYRVIITTAHLDQDPANMTRENLRALCQLCHNRLDAPHRAANAARTRAAQTAAAHQRAGQQQLF